MKAHAALTTAALLGLASTTQALMIDSFDSFQEVNVDGAAFSSANSFTAAPEAVGGERDLEVRKTVGLANEEVRARVNAIGNGFLRISIDEANGAINLVWDGVDNNASTSGGGIDFDGLGGLDLLANGGSEFQVGVEFSDLGGPVNFTIWDNDDPTGATFATGTMTIGNAIASTDPTVLTTLAFGSFSATGASLNDILDSAGAIQMSVDASAPAQEGWDLRLSFVGTDSIPPAPVTAPAGVALMGLAALGMVRRRKH